MKMKMKTMKRNEEEEEDKCSECVFTAHSAKERKTTTIHEPKVHTWTSIAKSLFAGGIAGGVSRTAVAPLERLKILQQVHGRTATEYGTVYRGLNTILQKDGLRGFFIGNGANCIRIVPNSAVKFFCYERITDAIFQFRRTLDPECEMNVFNRLAGGAGAGIIAMTSVYPLDMVRGRLTVQAGTVHQYNGMVDATRKIIQHEGVGSLYKGLLPSVIGVIPYVGLNFAVYETLKDMLAAKLELKSSKELSVAQSLTCGGFAGAVGQTVAYPFDVVRRRLQVAGWQGSASKTMEKAKYSGMMDCFGKIARYEGVGAFFHGLSANYIKVMPSIAIAFVTYEEVKRVLQVDLHISSGG
jgi:solute carrier family 25 phosphate transporter 23/24/25/41